jgi:hypothetical protein
MSSLIDALKEVSRKNSNAFRDYPLSSLNELQLCAKNLGIESPTITVPHKDVLLAAWDELVNWMDLRKAPVSLPMAVWKQVPFLIWWQHHGHPAIAYKHLFDGICWAASQSVSPVFWIEALARSYLEASGVDLSWRNWLGSKLKEWCNREPRPQLEEWRRRDRVFCIWSPVEFKNVMVQKLSHSTSSPVKSALVDAGFHSAVSMVSDLSREAFTAFLDYPVKISQGYSIQHFDRIIEWKEVLLAGNSKWPSLLSAAVINGLLEPWASFNPPDIGFQKKIKSQLESWFGPVPKEFSGHWRGTSSLSREILDRWKILDVMEQFFEQVGAYAEESRNQTMIAHWKHRSAFWLAYYKKGVVAKARALIGRRMISNKGEMKLRKIFGNAMARLESRDTMKCGLLLEINDLLIIDHSHNGRCYFYFPSNNSKPSVALSAYHSDQLESADEKLSHRQIPPWQSRFSSLIERQTGVRVLPRDYRIYQ